MDELVAIGFGSGSDQTVRDGHKPLTQDEVLLAMTLFEYYATLRKELISVISSVQDASEFGWRDDTTPNSVTRYKLEAIYERYLEEASGFGVYLVTRHAECGRESHEADYYIDNRYGLSIAYKDDNYVWTGGQMYKGERICKCPCSVDNKMSSHHVIDDVICEKSADQEVCKALERILFDIASSIQVADYKHSRSRIKENLLKAILGINDQIMPVSMDEYINHFLGISSRRKD